MAVASVGYVASVAVADRSWSGGSALGLTYGIVGFALMVFAGLLAARKKVRIWRIGRAQTWMRGHLWLGLLSFAIILFHAGLTFGGALTAVLMWTFLIVVISGVVGAALQHYLPRLMLARVPMETIYEQIPHVRAQLLVEADGIVSDACGGLAVVTDPAAERALAGASKLQTAVRIGADDTAPLREFYLAEMRPFIEKPDRAHPLSEKSHGDQVFARFRTLLPQAFHGAVTDLENICEEERQLSRQQKMHAWLHGWLLTHIPLSFALLVLAIVHIVMALRY